MFNSYILSDINIFEVILREISFLNLYILYTYNRIYNRKIAALTDFNKWLFYLNICLPNNNIIKLKFLFIRQ